MQPTKKSQPTTWDSEAKRTRKRLSKREKLALLDSYEARMNSGEERTAIIREFAGRIGVDSERQVERILAKAKEYDRNIRQHHTELSTTGLVLASNLNSYLDWGTGSIIGDVVYGGWLNEIDGTRDALSVEMYQVNRPIAFNLLFHLKGEAEEFPELTDVKDWAGLANDKITKDFVERLRLKANRGDFTGKCPACPS